MSIRSSLFTVALALSLAGVAAAQSDGINVPKTVKAGEPLTIQVSGDDDLLLVSPAQTLVKKPVSGSVQLKEGELFAAGHYFALQGGRSAEFDVIAADPTELSFFAKPSRLPVGLTNAISGVVYPFDQYGNLVLAPKQVEFKLSMKDGPAFNRTATTQDGVGWVKLDSSTHAGNANFVATLGNVSSTRIVQQVAADACNLRIHSEPSKLGVLVKTDPVKDCHGLPVPDGTIVTFTESGGNEMTTVDAPVKAGVASATLPAHSGATITVASGVAMGNQIRVGGGE